MTIITVNIKITYSSIILCRFQYFIRNETNKCSARLLVNGTSAVSGEQILPVEGNLPQHANLHLGGIPSVFSQYFSHVSMGFTGCMDSLKVSIVSNKKLCKALCNFIRIIPNVFATICH